MVRLFALVALVSLASQVLPDAEGAHAAPAEVLLYRIRVDDDAAIEKLQSAGAVVSRLVGDHCFAFVDRRLVSFLQSSGYEHVLLDPETSSRDYYLVQIDAPLEARIQTPLKLVDRAPGVALVATPRGEVKRVLSLGFEAAKLFRTPWRLRTQPDRVWPPERIEKPSGLIADLVASVAAGTLSSHVATLEAFGTRNAVKPQCRDAAKWIAAQFASFGIEQVEIRAWSPAYAGNVVATIPGTQTGGDVYVLGGHYDSIAPEARHEPGADDNASGTATLLECARLLASQQFEATVQIVAFGGEEYGLLGSEAYAQTAARRGERIVAMINLDMLGHLSPGDRRDLDIISNRGSEWLRDAARDVARQYVPQLSVLNGKLLSGTSDHASFWRAGYDAVFFYEDSAQPSPFIHTPDDVIGLSYNDVEFHSLCTKTAVALLATLARPVPVSVTIRAFSVQPEEAGVRVSWRLSRAARNTVTGIGVQRAASVQGPYVYCAQTLPPTTTQFVDTASHGKDLWYRLALEDAAGRSTYSRGQRASRSGRHSSLKQVYYTAAERAVGIRYEVAPSAQRVQLAVYDIRGRLVAQLVDAWVRPGMHFETWDGRDGRRNEISRGVYFIRLRGQRVSETRKLVVHANP